MPVIIPAAILDSQKSTLKKHASPSKKKTKESAAAANISSAAHAMLGATELAAGGDTPQGSQTLKLTLEKTSGINGIAKTSGTGASPAAGGATRSRSKGGNRRNSRDAIKVH